MAGLKINPNAEDCNFVEISPNFLSALTFAEGEFIHKKGKITTRWERTEKGIRLRICLPDGLKVRLVLPQGYACDGLVKEESETNVYATFCIKHSP